MAHSLKLMGMFQVEHTYGPQSEADGHMKGKKLKKQRSQPGIKGRKMKEQSICPFTPDEVSAVSSLKRPAVGSLQLRPAAVSPFEVPVQGT